MQLSLHITRRRFRPPEAAIRIPKSTNCPPFPLHVICSSDVLGHRPNVIICEYSNTERNQTIEIRAPPKKTHEYQRDRQMQMRVVLLVFASTSGFFSVCLHASAIVYWKCTTSVVWVVQKCCMCVYCCVFYFECVVMARGIKRAFMCMHTSHSPKDTHDS